jgi:adenylate kinase family enzyme
MTKPQHTVYYDTHNHNIRNANKIAIVGTPGAGKSYLAKILSEKLDLPLLHMDACFNYMLQGGLAELRATIEQRIPVVLAKIQEETQKPKWIIDGNYPSHVEAFKLRLQCADLVLYLNPPTEFCVQQIKQRGFTKTNGNYLDSTEKINDLVHMVENYQSRNSEIQSHIKNYASNKTIEFNSREQVNAFIASL